MGSDNVNCKVVDGGDVGLPMQAGAGVADAVAILDVEFVCDDVDVRGIAVEDACDDVDAVAILGTVVTTQADLAVLNGAFDSVSVTLIAFLGQRLRE